jgi:hypothetical protein
MAELTFKSAGVSIREIDLSQTSTLNPSGTPACVIGTATRGPAFVPVTVSSWDEFKNKFGPASTTSFGALAAYQWLNSTDSSPVTFVRVLGAGDGTASALNSGFVVGQPLPQEGEAGDPWTVGPNTSAGSLGNTGNTYMLGSYMKDADGSTYLADAGMTNVSPDAAATAEITINAAPAYNDKITLITTAGVSHVITFGTSLSSFSEDDSVTDTATDLQGTIDAITGFSATDDGGGVITVTQDDGGTDGNTAITLDNRKTMYGSADEIDGGTAAVAATAKIMFTSDPVDAATITIDASTPMVYNFDITGADPSTADILRAVDLTSISKNGADQFYTASLAAAAAASPGTAWTPSAVNTESAEVYSVTLTYGTAGVAGNLSISYDDNDTSASTFEGSDVDFTGGADATASSAVLILDNKPITGDTIVLPLVTVTMDTTTAEDASATTTAGLLGLDWDTASHKTRMVEEIASSIENGSHYTTAILGTQITVTAEVAGTADDGVITYATTADIVEVTSAVTDVFSGGTDTGNAVPVMHAMIMTPSGVLATLYNGSATTIDGDDGPATETLLASHNILAAAEGTAVGQFILQLNGLIASTDVTPPSKLEYELSLDPQSSFYPPKVLNTDPLAIEEQGHYLHMYKEIDESQAIVDGTGLTDSTKHYFLSPGSDTSTTGPLNNFEGRYNHAITPWVKSQLFGTTEYNLFRFHALTDGAGESDKFKIEIDNIRPPTIPGLWPTFNVHVRKFGEMADRDAAPFVGGETISFANCTLDPTDANYIAKKIGDKNLYYNLDKASPQLTDVGSYDNQSSVIRVEVSEKVSSEAIPVLTYPVGHRSYKRIKAGLLRTTDYDGSSLGTLSTVAEFPSPYRTVVTKGTEGDHDTTLLWGTQYSLIQDAAYPNKHSLAHSSFMNNSAIFLPTGMTSENDDEFSLENIILKYDGLVSDEDSEFDGWENTRYIRNRADTTPGTDEKYLTVDDLSASTISDYARFSFISQGGTSGTNMFREDKANLTNNAVFWEIKDSVKQHGKNGPTVQAYKTALNVLSSKSDSEFNLLTIPGIRNTGVTNFAIDMVEDRFDALYLMDIDNYDANGVLVTTSAQVGDADQTASNFSGLPYDSSFAAAYFPDVQMSVDGGDPVPVPATVGVLGAFANSDKMSAAWFAPAGFTRGTMDITAVQALLSRENLDNIYEAKINPITSFPDSPYVVWGQKTLLKSASSLDRINVRRLLIYIRRTVRAIALGFLFEPNRAETLEKFSAQINPFLQSIMDNQGLDRYKVKIDAETTTQIDVENNTLRGKIYVQPAKTAEFISIDFVVSNTI